VHRLRVLHHLRRLLLRGGLTVAEKTALPVEQLLEELIGDQSSDYADGDHPGYYAYEYDQATGLLTVTYDPDDDADHAPTAAVFRLVTVGIADDEGQDEDGH
jgi:hypothetical protein